MNINDAEVVHPENHFTVKKDAVPGEVLAITGKGPLIQTGEGQVILTDFDLESSKADGFIALESGRVPIILG